MDFGKNQPRFDWYQGTFHDSDPMEIARYLRTRYGLSDIRSARAKNGYERALSVHRGDVELAMLMWGGNSGVNVKGTGDRSPELAQYLRQFGEHRVTRADVCLDFIEEGLFDRFAAALLKFAVSKKIKINQQGDWERGEARTLYLGSRSSSCQLVIYEKGYQMDADKRWVRVEVRVYPKGKNGYKAAKMAPDDFFGASWVSKAVEVCGMEHCESVSLGTIYRPDDVQRARLAMIRQYKRTIENWVKETGSWEEFTGELKQAIADSTKIGVSPEIDREEESPLIKSLSTL